MDQQTLFNVLIGAVSAGGSWFLRTMWAEMKEQREQQQETNNRLSALDRTIASDYVKRDHLDKSLDRMFNALERIEDKLDRKVDKQ